MANSYVDTPGDGSTVLYPFTFGYLDPAHITLLVDGVSVTFTFSGQQTVQADVAPANGTNVRVKRTTPTAALVDFNNGSTLLEGDLDTATLQSIYIAQEAIDDVASRMAKDGVTLQWAGESLRITQVADGVDPQDAATKAQLDAAILAAGNVPTPANPGDDAKILTASGGTWSWQAPATVASTDITDSTATGRALLVAANAAVARASIGAQEIDADTAKTDVAQTFSAPQRKGESSVTSSGGTLTLDLSTSQDFETTLTEAITLANPTNQVVGQEGAVRFLQDGTGSRTVAFGSHWKFEGGTAPTVSTAANAVDLLVYRVSAANEITARLLLDVK